MAGICRRPGGGGGDRERIFPKREKRDSPPHRNLQLRSRAPGTLNRKRAHREEGLWVSGFPRLILPPRGGAGDAGGESDQGAGWLWGDPGCGSLQGAGLT